MTKTKLHRRLLLSGGVALASASILPERSAAEQRWHDPAELWDEFEPIPVQVVDSDIFHAPFRAAFLTWLEASRSRFPLPPSIEMAHGQTVLRVGQLGDAVEIRLAGLGDIDVFAQHDGFCWETLASMDVSAMERLDGGGWQNNSVRPQHRRTYKTRETCWQHDGFEPLLDWICDELAGATHLALYGDDEFTWTAASLVRDSVLVRERRPIAEDKRPMRHLLTLAASTS